MSYRMDRRIVVASLGAALVAPGIARGQAPPAKRQRIGVMMAVADTDSEGSRRLDAFRSALMDLGWIEGRNVAYDLIWYRGDFQVAQAGAKELVARGVDVMMINGTPGMDAMRATGAAVPIVFVVVSNPVGAGYVSNLSRPGSNITGFSTFEPEIAAKWLQLLRQVVPGLKTVNMLLDRKFVGFNSLWQAVEAEAPKHGITPQAAYASNLAEIEAALEALGRQEAPGLIVSPSPVNTVNRKRLIAMANEKGIPAIYPFRFYIQDGALLAYGFNATDQFKRAGDYVSRILRGEKPGDLPVQAPSVFELGINLVTAKSMGLTIPQSLLITADQIVE